MNIDLSPEEFFSLIETAQGFRPTTPQGDENHTLQRVNQLILEAITAIDGGASALAKIRLNEAVNCIIYREIK